VRDCDWGTVRGDVFAASPNANQMQDAEEITARFNTGFGEKLVILRDPRPNALTVDIYTTFNDRSRRANYVTTQQLRGERRRPPVSQLPPGPPPPQRQSAWQQGYGRSYTYSDDVYYQRCRNTVDPAGVIAGALIGGLLGNLAGNGSGGATVAGVIIGGAAGAALTSQLSCEDQSYAYRTYYDGLNAGYPNRTYRWQNPQNGHYGNFQVGDYYQDQYEFNCATYSQAIYINGRPQEAQGRACQQPDGTWVIVQ
jgi:surface antigen